MRINLDGLDVHYLETGSGAPILLLHGFPFSSAMWEPTMQRVGSGWRLIAPDFRGHGGTGIRPDAEMGHLASDMIELLDALGIREPAVVVGLSMGGYAALEMARRFPDRIRALVLVDTRAEADTEEGAEGRRQTADRVLREGSEGLARDMARKLFSPATGQDVREDWRERMEAIPPEGAAAALLGMAVRSDSFDVLRRWDRPLLIVVGEDDEITPPDSARRMHGASPGSRLKVIPRAGHLTPVERPDEFAAVLIDFLAGLPAGPVSK
jgi:3-oxoadipate enol-lactonase